MDRLLVTSPQGLRDREADYRGTLGLPGAVRNRQGSKWWEGTGIGQNQSAESSIPGFAVFEMLPIEDFTAGISAFLKICTRLFRAARQEDGC